METDRKTVYKVVAYAGDGIGYRSAIVPTRSGGLFYAEGLVTTPRVPSEPIFAFDTEEHAVNFMYRFGRGVTETVFEARATGVRPADEKLCLMNPLNAASRHKFWKLVDGFAPGYRDRLYRMLDTGTVPRGTVWCDSLELVRHVR